ncbi:Tar ligand binding domain-containing protein, partial [Sulfuriferula thiophila]|uniref:Tar ligand binding domain-containing protein n=1 Tax=Sulfuriferula thiophila TaxID=1781211 RepID=UPI000F609D91
MFSRISIKNRLIAAFTMNALLLLFVGGLGIYTAKHNVYLLESLTLKDKSAEADIVRIKYRMEFNRSELLRAIQHDPTFSVSKMHDHPVTKHIKSIEASNKILKEKADAYQAGISDPEEKQLFDNWLTESNNMGTEAIKQVVADIQANQWEEAAGRTVKVINPLYTKSDANSKALVEYLTKRAEKNRVLVRENIAQMTYFLIAILSLGVIMAIITGWLLIRSITVPLHHAVEVARRVADGDLRSDVTVIHQDEIGDVLNALKDMNVSLAHIVGEVRVGTETIASASSEIAAGNLDLSNRTEAQAGSLEETASAMEELTSTVKQNADNARQANQLAGTASEVAVKGGAVVSEVVATMGAINESARKIADIIGVIDGIAFQTN